MSLVELTVQIAIQKCLFLLLAPTCEFDRDHGHHNPFRKFQTECVSVRGKCVSLYAQNAYGQEREQPFNVNVRTVSESDIENGKMRSNTFIEQH